MIRGLFIAIPQLPSVSFAVMNTSLDLASSIPEAVQVSALKRSTHGALYAHRDGTWRELSYQELSSRIRRLALALIQLGLKPGERVAVLGANSPEWGLAYLAILQAKGVVVPLDRLLKVDEWIDILKRSGASMVFCATQEGTKLTSQPAAVSAVSHYISLDHGAAMELTLQGLIAGSEDPGPASTGQSRDALAAIIFTSGTTGKSKGVMLSHGNILTNAEWMLQAVDIESSRDRFLSVLPMSHCYECTGGFLAPLLAGAQVYYARGLVPSEIVEDLRTSGATLLLGVPLLFEKIVAGIERGLSKAGLAGTVIQGLWGISRAGRPVWGHRLGRALLGSVRAKAGVGTVRYLVSGGAPLPPRVSYSLEALGVRVLQGYGLTETSPLASISPLRGGDPASVGRSGGGVEVRIHEPDAAGVGEIWIKGPNVMQGYWRDPESTSQVMHQGWFKTGDLGRLSRRQDLLITGRSKNLIVSPGGKNISPEEIEMAVSLSPFVSEILVCGATVEGGSGEEVFAYVHPDFDYIKEQGTADLSEDELRALVRNELDRTTDHLAGYKRIVRFEVSHEPFVKTSTKKIKRHMHLGGGPQ